MSDVEIVCEGLAFPEGPVAMPDGSVIVVEIKAGQLTRVAPDGTKSLVADVGGGPNGLAIGPDGAMYVCNNGGFIWTEIGEMNIPVGPGGVSQPPEYTSGSIQRVDLATGDVTTVYTACGENKLNGPNDIVFDADGNMWFTDLGKTRERDIDRGFIYWAKPDGSEIRQVAAGDHGYNGIGLSPDGKTLFAVTTSNGHLYSWAVVGPGELSGGNPLMGGGNLVYAGEHGDMYDSLAIDGEGNVCIATLLNKPGISVISPTGQVVDRVEFPDPMPTNICFGGDDLRTAWITLSAFGKLAKVDWARPGLKLNF